MCDLKQNSKFLTKVARNTIKIKATNMRKFKKIKNFKSISEMIKQSIEDIN